MLLAAGPARAQEAPPPEVDVAALVERLAGPDEADRQDARERLSRLGAGGQEALRKLLGHANPTSASSSSSSSASATRGSSSSCAR